jgi:nucleotide-binding universal stress UspA family protein
VFTTIVVGLDGSEGSKMAVPVAAELAGRNGASRVVIVHVDERIPAKGGVHPVRADEEQVREELDEQARQLASQGIDVKFDVVEIVLGGPAHAIEDVAEREGAELIVVGRRGHSPVAGLVLGSVTQRLLHIARRSVLAAPPAD